MSVPQCCHEKGSWPYFRHQAVFSTLANAEPQCCFYHPHLSCLLCWLLHSFSHLLSFRSILLWMQPHLVWPQPSLLLSFWVSSQLRRCPSPPAASQPHRRGARKWSGVLLEGPGEIQPASLCQGEKKNAIKPYTLCK